MTAITGSQAKAAMKIAGTFGTAVAVGVGDQIDGCTISDNENAEELTIPPIGSGLLMKSDSERGAVAPTINIDGALGVQEPRLAAVAQMFGGCSVQALGSGAYVHSILFNNTISKYLTTAFQAHNDSAGVKEYPSCSTTEAVFSSDNPPNYVNLALALLGNELKLTSQENDYSELSAVTRSNTKRVVFQFSDEFLINAQAGGALSSPTDRKNITGFTLTFQRPQEFAREAKGSSGNGAPVATGDFPFLATLQINFRTLEDFTFFTAHQAGTEYKASLTCTGSLIGGSNYYTFQVMLPRLKIVQSPESNLSEAGNNPLSVTFEGLVATGTPTGMLDKYPYMRIINDRSTSYYA